MNDDPGADEKSLRDALAPLRAVVAHAMDIPAARVPTGVNGEILDAIREPDRDQPRSAASVTVQPPSLGCARCGSCCQSIPMNSLEQLVSARAAGRYDDDPRSREDIDFMAAHWMALPGQRDRYSCDQFDPESRTCRAQDAKPPVCRDYPWYRDGPTPERASALDPRCSYLLEVPPHMRPEGSRPLIPIEAVKR